MPAPTSTSSGGVGILSNATNTSHNIMSPQNQQQQHIRPPLRRATYVHVSDLTSAYNIDHGRLEKELRRVKHDRLASQMNPESRQETATAQAEGGTMNSSSSKASPPGDVIESSPSASQAQNNNANKRLQPPRGGYNLCLLVGSVEVVVDKLRVDGSRVRLAEVEVGDETGTVSLRARDDQIDLLNEISERKGAVVLRNSTLELYQGKHIRLAVTKWGKLTPYPDQVASTPAPPSRRNTDRYFSLIDLSTVASEMAVFSTSSGLDTYTTSSSMTSHSNNNNTNNTRSNDLGSSNLGVAPASRGNNQSNNINNHGNNRNSRRGGAAGQSRGKGHGGMGTHGMSKNQLISQHTSPYPLMTLHNYGYAPSPPQLGDHAAGWWQPRGRGVPPQHGHHHHDPATAQLLMQQQYELASHRAHLAAAQHQQLHYQSLTAAAGQNPAFGAPADVSGRTPAFPPPPAGVYASSSMGSLPEPAAPGAHSPHHSPRMNPQAPTFDPVFPKK